MDKHTIGTHAGIVWRLMNNDRRWTFEDLKRATRLSDRHLCAAIGWLAREDKIQMLEDDNHQVVFFQYFNSYY